MTALIILFILIPVFLLWYGAVPRRAGLSSRKQQGALDQKRSATAERFKLATYNIHGGKGTDGIRDLARTTEVIRGAQIVALQEVRAGWLFDQTREMSHALGLNGLFVPTLRRWFRDRRGNGLLSAFTVGRWQSYALPNAGGYRYRIYTVAEIEIGETILSILFTHLHTRAGRERQLRIVLEHFARLPLPSVLVGDLNSRKYDPVLLAGLPDDVADAIAAVLGTDDEQRVDWILTRGLDVRGGGRTGVGISDHPYYWVEVRI